MRTHRLLSSVTPLALALSAACDLTVTNPGPTPDEELDNPLAYNTIVVGARLALARAYGSDGEFGGQIAYWSAALAFEINPAGSTGSFGIPSLVQAGTMTASLANGDWSAANNARFVAEDAIRRFATVAAADSTKKARPNQIAEAALYAGYANRLLGENFCGAVLPDTVNGVGVPGDSSAHTDYFVRAESLFTYAIDAANQATGSDTTRAKTLRTAAYAGRASVRADLATYGLRPWSEATADAAQVTSRTFVFQLPYSNNQQSEYNYIYWARGANPYRAHTQWGTFYEHVRDSTGFGDPRVPWVYNTTTLGDAAVQKFGGRVPFWPENKHSATSSPINLSSGWEMRLIAAEALLAAGNSAAAIDSVNVRRAALNPAQPAYDRTVPLDAAWTLLKTERAIELWLEARRLGDLRRWMVNNVPGPARDGLYRAFYDAANLRGDSLHTNPIETMTSPVPRSLCFPIGQNEHETNPNLP